MVQKVIENQGPHEVLMRATIGSKKYGKAGTFAHINVKEAWLAQGPGPAAGAGPLMKIEDSGVRCITYPCPSFREKRLNSSVSATIADLQWDRSGANDRLISQALDKMHTDGLIVSGDRTSVTGPGGEGKARSVTQLWLKATNEAPQQCFVGGCSGQVCSDEEGVITTCEYRPEYACYQAASCEVQDDGHCGWTQTEELQSCLAQN
jgi:eight-cysteine-cluster-containing protein